MFNSAITLIRVKMIRLREVLAKIRQFTNVIDDSQPHNNFETTAVVRANLESLDDAQKWLGAFGKSTKTNWIIDKCRQSDSNR
jgi:hypothetical protein